jgi:hypothetical protein
LQRSVARFESLSPEFDACIALAATGAAPVGIASTGRA